MQKPLVLLPAYSHLDWRLADCLRRTGLPCIQVFGCSDLVQARSRLLCDAMQTEAETFLFIDADMVVTPDNIFQLLESPKLSERSAVTGAYITANGELAGVPLDVTQQVSFGGEPRFVQMALAGLGFAAIRRSSIEALERVTPPVRSKADEIWRPYFLPFVIQHELPNGEEMREYLADDYSFWWRVRTMAETSLWLDTSLRVGHVKTSVLTPGDVLFRGIDLSGEARSP